ncbi:alpha-L-rhamnosidase-related protein [Dysgonomonas termitidis]|uniref:alpha-L-rhamnosidase n=1 Tax=Dysgonomonas termitidis TaxID=1516126 RepID=A0ABV9L2C6_9BACT
MKKTIFVFLSILFSCIGVNAINNARWITVPSGDANKPNTWISFRKDFNIEKVPSKALTQIAVDSKYWFWINGQMVIFEGGLKRGPNPRDTYYDEVDLAPYLKKGQNKIAILLWHFGKEGYSHKNSGKAGLIFNLKEGNIELISDNSWLCKIHPAYGNTGEPYPNLRLPESNIHFDANKDIANWQTEDSRGKYGFVNAHEIGKWGDAPWNTLVKRPIPQWKDFGIKTVKYKDIERKKGTGKDTIIAAFPYNMQMTPVLDVTDKKGGSLISIFTDHLYGGSDVGIRAEYVTKKGKQTYESIGWMNGHKLMLVVPSDVTVNSIKYRETGYNADPVGSFSCDDEFYMRFWKKALRTLYVNMRDTYFDCPDRERAQWWGDEVVLMGESFYTYSTPIHDLMKKGIHELIGWQKEDGVLHSPIPEGNYGVELPGQMLASIGHYGFWNYYMNTGDKQTIQDVYPGVKKYLSLWSLDDTGLTAFRPGAWTWGDWGNNRDMRLIYAGWHYLALKGAASMADLLGYTNDAKEYRIIMEKVKDGYNQCWNDKAYRHPEYKEETDDRVQALAVISGIADQLKYDAILKVFETEFHASPYMEKYIMEALFMMGQGEYGVERSKKRLSAMVNNTEYTTLFEGWYIGDIGELGGGTVNHAWSGGALTVIAQYICGIYPLEAGYKVFKIEPEPATFKTASISVPSIAGMIKSKFVSSSKEFTLEVVVPYGTEAIIYLPVGREREITINGKIPYENEYKTSSKYLYKTKVSYQLPAGNYKISVK